MLCALFRVLTSLEMSLYLMDRSGLVSRLNYLWKLTRFQNELIFDGPVRFGQLIFRLVGYSTFPVLIICETDQVLVNIIEFLCDHFLMV